VHAIDHTPEDEITIIFVNNGIKQEFVKKSGEAEIVDFTEGKNSYTAYAFDKAGNISQTIQGVAYYLPGPLDIEFIEPSCSPYIVRGLPPLPDYVDKPKLDLEIEVDDGIGDVPETIRYCRIHGNGQDFMLHNNNDYTFTGNVVLDLEQPANTFIVQVEDLAGTVKKKPLIVRFTR
jgi:hypothetical protein